MTNELLLLNSSWVFGDELIHQGENRPQGIQPLENELLWTDKDFPALWVAALVQKCSRGSRHCLFPSFHFSLERGFYKLHQFHKNYGEIPSFPLLWLSI